MSRYIFVALVPVVPGFAQVVSYEGTAFPEDAGVGWIQLDQLFPADRWIDDGSLFQAPVLLPCPPACNTQDSYRRDLDGQAGVSSWFLTWSMTTDGPPVFSAVAPASIVAGGISGVNYHFTIGDDQIRLIRDASLPLVFADFEPGPHVFRLELRGTESFTFWIDTDVIDTGLPEGPYPTSDSSITFRGKAALVDSITQWDYVRFGSIPDDASGDFDSDGAVDLDDYYFFQECAANSSPGASAGPGCRWADMDADTDVDLIDFGLWQAAFTGG